MKQLDRQVPLFILILLLTAGMAFPQQVLTGADFIRVEPDDVVIPESLLKTVDLNLERVTFGQALSEIAELGGLAFNFNHDRIPVEERIILKVQQTRIIDALIKLMSKTNTHLVITSAKDFAIVPDVLEELETQPIRGTLEDAETGEPVPAGTIQVLGLGLAAATDIEGRYEFPALAEGVYALSIRHLGYEPLVVDVYHGNGHFESSYTIKLQPTVLNLSDVTITPGSFSFMDVSPASPQTLTREDIETVPQFGEDIYRAVKRLPGLSSGDYAAHFSVRGGRPDETLVIFDGLELREPFHLKEYQDGALSIIDIEAIDNVNLMTGGFPTEYGNRMSGVFDITSRDPREGENKYTLGLSLMNARATTEGTFANGKGAWFTSARRGYLDAVLGLLNADDIPKPAYYDIFSKVRYDLNENHRISVNLLHSRDRFTFDTIATTGYLDTIDTKEYADNTYGNSYLWTRLQSKLHDQVRVTTLLSAGLVTQSQFGYERYTRNDEDIYSLDDNRDYTVYQAKQDWQLDVTEWLMFKTGIDLKQEDVDYKLVSTVGQNPDDPSPDSTQHFPVVTENNYVRDSRYIGTYLAAKVRLFPGLFAEAGARYDQADHSNDEDFSPRAHLMYSPFRNGTLRFGWGQYRQIHSIEQVAELNGATEYYPSELSEQWTVGYQHNFDDGSRLRIEGYVKEVQNPRPLFRNWNEGINFFNEVDEDRIFLVPDKMTSRGVELYFTRSFGRTWSFQGSYALAFLEETISTVDLVNERGTLEFDRTHDHPRDQRHALYLDLAWRPNHLWTVSGALAYHSGWPITLATMYEVTDEDGEIDYTVRPNKLYANRLPDYYRFDVRVTRRYAMTHGDLRVFLEVANLTNHENIYSYDFYRSPGVNGGKVFITEPETWFTILPSFGVSWTGNL